MYRAAKRLAVAWAEQARCAKGTGICERERDEVAQEIVDAVDTLEALFEGVAS